MSTISGRSRNQRRCLVRYAIVWGKMGASMLRRESDAHDQRLHQGMQNVRPVNYQGWQLMKMAKHII
ncbi:hypothetical protein GWE18_39105 [Bradyrhizobium sp. CSA112]|uniref:hypothetical protein n=1 Tax=Bradyrhizobium sp. CSA112 TaxID=2699170 RepID=UPI0023B1B131|nr:hypothetical protein [Bradyrhizobium sp. CSA112]MDE5458673.1 hypothetical protein [Bradyrhizobium sp. CSA112]